MTSIINSPLSDRARNALEKAGIDTIEKLRRADNKDLLKLNNVGSVTVAEIRLFLSGIEFAQCASPSTERLERIATAVLAGMCANSMNEDLVDADLAALSVSKARALIAELDKEPAK